MRVALITGITGQDGSYLAELLLDKGYKVHGTIRRASLPNLSRLEGIESRLQLHWGDLTDGTALSRIMSEVKPDEVYNLGAMSDVSVSFQMPEYTGDVTGLGAARLLEAVRQGNGQTRFYQAGSSEMFGMNPDVPTNEESTFVPGSPYAIAKAYAYHMTRNYREAYGMFAANGILFNHESERRGVGFVTQKIVAGLAGVLAGRTEKVVLGNLDAKRDWGHARDYVRAMHAILQQDDPEDFVIATGHAYTVRDFLDRAFERVGLDWQRYVTTDPSLCRPLDPPILLGDASKARRVLGWEPEVGFDELVALMVDHALRGT